MKLTAVEPFANFVDRARGILVIGQIDLDMILGACIPWALLGGKDAANR